MSFIHNHNFSFYFTLLDLKKRVLKISSSGLDFHKNMGTIKSPNSSLPFVFKARCSLNRLEKLLVIPVYRSPAFPFKTYTVIR